MCSRNEDLPRFIKFYDQKIKEKVLENFSVYQKSKKQVDMLPDEKAEAKIEK